MYDVMSSIIYVFDNIHEMILDLGQKKNEYTDVAKLAFVIKPIIEETLCMINVSTKCLPIFIIMCYLVLVNSNER